MVDKNISQRAVFALPIRVQVHNFSQWGICNFSISKQEIECLNQWKTKTSITYEQKDIHYHIYISCTKTKNNPKSESKTVKLNESVINRTTSLCPKCHMTKYKP